MGAGAVLNNQGTITTQGDSGIALASGTATVSNAGTFNIEGSCMNVQVAFNNSGTVNIDGGVLMLSGGGQSSGGTFNIAATYSLVMSGAATSTYTFGAATTISTGAGDATTSPGSVFFSGGTSIVNCAL